MVIGDGEAGGGEENDDGDDSGDDGGDGPRIVMVVGDDSHFGGDADNYANGYDSS